jgi:hypothetical protein
LELASTSQEISNDVSNSCTVGAPALSAYVNFDASAPAPPVAACFSTVSASDQVVTSRTVDGIAAAARRCCRASPKVVPVDLQ